MAHTIPGGAYQDATGDGWHDANGRPLSKAQIAEAKKLIAQQESALAELEQRRAEQDPDALRSLAALLRVGITPQSAAPVATQPESSDPKDDGKPTA